MFKYLVLALWALAAPAIAQQQQQPECRGKSYFQLGGGTYGCLAAIENGSYRNTTTWDDGFTSKSKVVNSAVVLVFLFGPFDENGSKVRGRVQSLCKAFSGGIAEAMDGARYTDVIIDMVWPDVVAGQTADGQDYPARQAGFTTNKCKGARLFDL